jgi:uncharacterized membrane protein
MDNPAIVHLLRLVHVLGGVLWVGTVVFLAGFLLPSVRAAGPAGGPIMQQLVQARRLPLWLMGAAILTVLSGIALYWRDSAGFTSAWLASDQAQIFGLGGVLALSAVVLGMAVNSPAGKQLGELTARLQAAGRAPAPDEVATLQALQRKLARATTVGAVLLVLATAAMAVARYVP